MEMWTLFLRTVLIYIVVFLTMRIMGKREIGKLSVFDLVISIMIAEIAVFVLEDLQKPLLDGILPMVTLVGIQILIAFISLKSEKLRRIFEGEPTYIVKNGKLDREEMKNHRYNLDDLLLQLRQSKVMDVADVEFAILEPSGKLTVIEKETKDKESIPDQPNAASDEPQKSSIRYEGLPVALIMDGKVQEESLRKLDKTRFWLKNELQAKGIKDFKDVFYCSYDHRGKWFIDLKR
ncbi:DUF421 domain-containing protein [Paenibacillus piri]|uniref:DUF421 domain-containing protein n=1 Tax=Paenibacillus piri TaxID=2547395 RepID=A0A4R5KQ31_9BACL|nr:DUF421 domain-containing protein [Paenibacillus piri]TDF97666.1 DUF421 domain-containing protein [Paenibacillus piri]